MELTTTKDTRILPLIALYDMQTTFFDAVLEGISDSDAQKRLDTKANHIAWLAGSLVQQRYEMNGLLGGKNLQQGAHDLFKDNQGIKDEVTYPSLQQLKEDWHKITPVLKNTLVHAVSEKLDGSCNIPGMEYSIYEMVLFSIYREANCIGQIALWRRLLGYEPMKYM